MKTLKSSGKMLVRHLGLDVFTFICSASYELRCLSIARKLADRVSKSAIFAIENLNVRIDSNLARLKNVLPDSDVVMTDLAEPDKSASLIDKEVQKLLRGRDSQDVVVDITTFTHEHLLFLFKSLYARRERIRKLRCVYTSAKEYSFDERGQKKWLSKGCKDLRSVIGYPGIVYPGVGTVVILIVGFEHERASCVIDEMAPEYLYLGFGRPDKATAAAHKVPMRVFNRIVAANMATRKNVCQFKFASADPEDLRERIDEIIKSTASCNHIIVPMNTKLSTLATALIAFHNNDVQICYAQPETYNFNSYSKAGSTFHVVEVNFNGAD